MSVVIVDCRGPGPRGQGSSLASHLDRMVDRDLLVLQADSEAGRGPAVDLTSVVVAPADVVMLDSDCLVADGWLEGLRKAAYSDGAVSTASAMVDDGGFIWINELGTMLEGEPAAGSFDDIAAAVRARSVRLRPRLSTASTVCTYVRRSAVDLAGGLSEDLSFSDRCVRMGLSHVLADDVLVQCRKGVRPLNLTRQAKTPTARSLNAARRAIAGLSLVMDARALAGPLTGTQVHLLELLAALARVGEVRVQAVVTRNLSAHARKALSEIEAVEVRSLESTSPVPRADVVHRPFQVWNLPDLALLREFGERLVITQQDLIGYRTPSYFRSQDEWERYRSLTRQALAVADQVVFFSEHALADARADNLVEPNRASVVRLGVDHRLGLLGETPARPSAAARVPEHSEFVLCIGTDLRHKNRVFALHVLEQLRVRHDWDGWVVLAGPHAEFGSSAVEEASMLAAHPDLDERTLDLGAVSESEKAWLLARAKVVLYPTLYEGFGLVPFEAADHSAPCMWATGTALSEVLPDAEAAIVPWSPEQTSDRLLALLRDQAARQRNLAAIRAASANLRWDATAAQLLDLYRRACDQSPPPAAVLHELQPESALSADGLRLLGPGGALPTDLERPLLALATHPRLSAPLFGAVKAGYQVSHRLRRARR